MPKNQPSGGGRRKGPKAKQPVPQTPPPELSKTLARQRAGGRRPGPKGVDWRPAYLLALGETGMVTRASEAAQVSPVSVYQERKKNPEFAAAEKEAEVVASGMLEAEAVRRAVHGLVRYRFTKDGDPLRHPETGEWYYELEYSDTLLAKLLTGRLPERYRDKIAMEHSGKVTHEHLTLEELEQRMKEARA